MRTIKFRAFNKEDKTICDVVRIDLFVKCALVKLKNGRHKDFSFDDIELMQFTGLYDKNGKEIYEGDVCSGHSDGIGVIEWEDLSGGYDYVFPNEDIVGIWEVIKDIVVIGNIHENPELLEQ